MTGYKILHIPSGLFIKRFHFNKNGYFENFSFLKSINGKIWLSEKELNNTITELTRVLKISTKFGLLSDFKVVPLELKPIVR